MRSKDSAKSDGASAVRQYPDLKTLVFSAKIDFLTVITPGKLPLPKFTGRHNWSPKHNWTRMTVHDPKRPDIAALIDMHGPLPLAEVEVCVDVNCARTVPVLERDQHLMQVLVHMFGRGLNPDGRGLIGSFRSAYRHGPTPFNLRLPDPSEQLLFGHKTDAAQVKAYYKRIDQGLELRAEDQVARVEVALRHDALQVHGLATVAQLLGFHYRRELSRYFRHVKDVSRRELHRRTLRPLHQVLVTRAQQDLRQEFDRVGMGSVKRGGKFGGKPVRVHQDIAVNNRIGQALLRLERALVPEIRAPDHD